MLYTVVEIMCHMLDIMEDGPVSLRLAASSVPFLGAAILSLVRLTRV